jgi:hypothetical protein
MKAKAKLVLARWKIKRLKEELRFTRKLRDQWVDAYTGLRDERQAKNGQAVHRAARESVP